MGRRGVLLLSSGPYKETFITSLLIGFPPLLGAFLARVSAQLDLDFSTNSSMPPDLVLSELYAPEFT